MRAVILHLKIWPSALQLHYTLTTALVRVASTCCHVFPSGITELSDPLLHLVQIRRTSVVFPHSINIKISDTLGKEHEKHNSLCPGTVQSRRWEQHQSQEITIHYNDCRRGHLWVANICNTAATLSSLVLFTVPRAQPSRTVLWWGSLQVGSLVWACWVGNRFCHLTLTLVC